METDGYDFLVENIKTIIRNQKLKQYAVAEKAGFNEQDFSNMLNGRKLLKAEYIGRIALALNVTPNDIFGYGKQKTIA